MVSVVDVLIESKCKSTLKYRGIKAKLIKFIKNRLLINRSNRSIPALTLHLTRCGGGTTCYRGRLYRRPLLVWQVL